MSTTPPPPKKPPNRTALQINGHFLTNKHKNIQYKTTYSVTSKYYHKQTNKTTHEHIVINVEKKVKTKRSQHNCCAQKTYSFFNLQLLKAKNHYCSNSVLDICVTVLRLK